MQNISDEIRQKWALVIGNFIITLGSIESTVTEIIRLSALPAQIKILTNLNFGRKAELVKAVLEDWNRLDDESVKDIFNKLSEIIKRRNIVAHNGFSIAFYETPEDDEDYYEVGLENSNRRTDVWLQIEDLQRDIDTLNLIYGKLIYWIQKDKVKNLS
jgi:hypothetical protein